MILVYNCWVKERQKYETMSSLTRKLDKERDSYRNYIKTSLSIMFLMFQKGVVQKHRSFNENLTNEYFNKLTHSDYILTLIPFVKT